MRKSIARTIKVKFEPNRAAATSVNNRVVVATKKSNPRILKPKSMKG